MPWQQDIGYKKLDCVKGMDSRDGFLHVSWPTFLIERRRRLQLAFPWLPIVMDEWLAEHCSGDFPNLASLGWKWKAL